MGQVSNNNITTRGILSRRAKALLNYFFEQKKTPLIGSLRKD
jgi:hypothetical protein